LPPRQTLFSRGVAIDKPEFQMIYIKTELGKTALQDKSLGLSPRQRAAFIMFDGKRTAAEVLKLTTALGMTADDLNRLVDLGLLTAGGATVAASSAESPPGSTPTASPASASILAPSDAPRPVLSEQAQYARAYPIAVRLTSNLGLRGFRLNLAVESAGNLEALKDLAPKIKEAIGVEKFRELEDALYR
jgi:hypothetical protein